MKPEGSVDAVIVAFNPEPDHLIPLVTELLDQVHTVHVIDNTPPGGRGVGDLLARFEAKRVVVAPLGDNLGVSKAFNLGIRAAMARGATHVLLSDQDSLPMPGMVARLLLTLEEQMVLGRRVAIVGPDFVNDIDYRPYRFRGVSAGSWVYPSVRPSPESPVLDVAAIISSGSLMSLSSLQVVGFMRDDLFVDYVDIEWCERARRLGYICLADGRALMKHRMGEDRLSFWLFRRRAIARYGPLRLHYQARNATYLGTRGGVSIAFRFGVIVFLAAKVYAYSAARDCAAVRALLRGIADGLSGRLGRL